MNVCFLLFLIQLSSCAYDPTRPIVPMTEYKKEYRTFNCWECFTAQGKMCYDQDDKSMILATGSSNKGHGICCRPDYYGNLCKTHKTYKCSEPTDA